MPVLGRTRVNRALYAFCGKCEAFRQLRCRFRDPLPAFDSGVIVAKKLSVN